MKVSIVFFILVLSSCVHRPEPSNEELNLKYILIKRSGTLDTVPRKIQHWVETDSFATITYQERRHSNDKIDFYEQTYKFPKKREYDSLTQYRLLESKTFKFEERAYQITKYLYDDEGGDDEEMLFFYSSEFGIILFRGAAWGNYERFVASDDHDKDRIIFFLVEMIANNDKEFLFNW